ncbi:MAG TPA: ABC transporter ATP-binding protein [Chloroflexi bacterium]|nr:ABC transporter ATP-binding protein [Chloroflexota bacterium]
MIELEGVKKSYQQGSRKVEVLKGVDLFVGEGEFVAVVGPSGSGKSTLLNIIGGLDRPTQGRVMVAGEEISRMDEEALARWRGRNIGFVFQFFQLLPTLTALENVMLPMELMGTFKGRRKERAMELLEMVGLADRAHHLPGELSGGEQQRVALARALVNDPPIILADEPTGNLDSVSGARVMRALSQFHRQGKTIVLVTHQMKLAQEADRVLQLQDGVLNEPDITLGR